MIWNDKSIKLKGKFHGKWEPVWVISFKVLTKSTYMYLRSTVCFQPSLKITLCIQHSPFFMTSQWSYWNHWRWGWASWGCYTYNTLARNPILTLGALSAFNLLTRSPCVATCVYKTAHSSGSAKGPAGDDVDADGAGLVEGAVFLVFSCFDAFLSFALPLSFCIVKFTVLEAKT